MVKIILSLGVAVGIAIGSQNPSFSTFSPSPHQLTQWKLKCGKGDTQSCLLVGNYYYLQHQWKKAYRFFLLCKDKNGGCLNNLALLYFSGFRPISRAHLLLMFKRACKMGDKIGCLNYQTAFKNWQKERRR